MKISISEELKKICPAASLGILQYKAKVTESSDQLLCQLDSSIQQIISEQTMESIQKMPHIWSTRQAYRAFGKAPSEYRNASEAMLRRILKGQGLYHINNVVEVNNIVSISSGYSIGSYDVGKLQGPLELRHADENTHYAGIGKGSINIGNLPVIYDDLGAVGNPTSDSRRAMVQPGDRELISILYSFDGPGDLNQWLETFAALLKKYCSVSDIQMWII